MFRRVVHCDWSTGPGKRWGAAAERSGAGWRASGPFRVPAGMGDFVEDLRDPEKGPTLAAFDFPIGLPLFFREPMKCDRFVHALDLFGKTELLEQVLVPADTLDDVSKLRPFYPDRQGAKGDKLRQPWLDRLGPKTIDDLLRTCETGGDGSPAAGCMFWLTGARTVGKAAIHGWTEVVRPARATGAKLWPFDGDLSVLAAGNALVLAESYPADALRQLGLAIRTKTDRGARAARASDLLARASALRIAPDDGLAAALRDGFPADAGSDDGFDAVVGLLAAVAVVDGEREAAPPLSDDVRAWEGWILGRGPRQSMGSITPSASTA